MRNSTKIFFLGFVALYLLCLNFWASKKHSEAIYQQGYSDGYKAGKECIFSIEELQKKLSQKGFYDAKIDGCLGPATKTAWDKAICEQYAEKYSR